MDRVAVIGPVAAGKSTLGRDLAAALDLPFIDLDDVYFAAGATWTDASWAERHRALVAADRWLIAGDHRAVAADRFARADLVVWLDPPRWWCLLRAVRRHLRGSAGPLLPAVRWIHRYAHHGRVETERTLATFQDLSVLRFRGARNISTHEISEHTDTQ